MHVNANAHNDLGLQKSSNRYAHSGPDLWMTDFHPHVKGTKILFPGIDFVTHTRTHPLL